MTDEQVAVRYPRHFWIGLFLVLFLIPGYLLEDHHTWRPDDGEPVPGYVKVLYRDSRSGTLGELYSDTVNEQVVRLETGSETRSFLIEQEKGRYSPFVDLDHFYEVEVVSDGEQIVTHHYELALLNRAEVRYRATDKAIELIHAKSGFAGGFGYLLAFVFSGLLVVGLRILITMGVWLLNLIRRISDF